MKQLRSLFSLPVLTIFVLAVSVRVMYNRVVANGYYPLHDSQTYQAIALNILHEHCYCYLPHLSTVDRAPLWPLAIAAIYAVLGEHDMMVRLFLSLVGAGTCVLIYYFVRDLFGSRIALIAGLAASVYPFLFIYDGWLYSESLYIFLLFAFCYALYRLQRTPSRSLMLISGILLGLVSLTRPNGLIILGLFIAWAMVLGIAKVQTWRILLQSVVLITLVTLVIILPWTIRNYVVTHALVPIATGDGKVLIGAYNNKIDNPNSQDRQYYQQYLGTWLKPEEVAPQLVKQFPANCSGACEVARDNVYKAAALQWIGSHLNKLPHVFVLHAAYLWQTTSSEADFPFNRFPDRIYSKLTIVLMELYTPLLFLLAAIGLIVTLRRWRELLFIYSMIALTFAQSVALYGFARFRAPIEPMLLVLAAGAVWWLATLFMKRRKGVEQSMPVPILEKIS